MSLLFPRPDFLARFLAGWVIIGRSFFALLRTRWRPARAWLALALGTSLVWSVAIGWITFPSFWGYRPWIGPSIELLVVFLLILAALFWKSLKRPCLVAAFTILAGEVFFGVIIINVWTAILLAVGSLVLASTAYRRRVTE